MKVTRHIHLASPPAQIRTASFEGRDRVVVPIVALVEGVIEAIGSEGPELVLASEFSIAPWGWNGRPVMNDHPMDGDAPVSANVPKVLEQASYGQVFNAAVSGKKLVMEEWIDPAKAASIGGEAQKTLNKVLAGQATEISVGLSVVVEPTAGVWNGKPYTGIWREISPDHIANLPEGARGACSNAMGCGTLRTARITEHGFEEVQPMAEPIKRRTLRERFSDLFRSAVKGWNQSEIRAEVRDALKAIEPLFDYLDDVWEDDGYIIYCVYAPVNGGTLAFAPEGYPLEPYTTKTYRRNFTMAKDGAVTFEDRVEVEFVGEFKPVRAAGDRAACSCGGTVPATQSTTEGDEAMKTKNERAAALAANEFSPIRDLKTLTDSSDAVLDGLEAHCASAATAKAASDKALKDANDAKATAETALRVATEAAAAPKTLTTEEIMAASPEIAGIVTRFKAAEAAQKVELVTKLKAAQSVHDEAALNAMSLDALRNVAALVKVAAPTVDYTGRFAGTPEGDPTPETDFAPPDAYAPGLAAIKAAGSRVQ